MNPNELNHLYWIISAFATIAAFILVVTWDRKAQREKKWREQNRRNELDRLLDWDENSYH